MFAVVRTGGKQYRVQEGRPVTIERLPGEAGQSIELNDVLMLADGDNITIGAPAVEGARVLGTITEQGRAKKILVFRYKNKTRARKKNGHRQQFTTLMVDDVLASGQQPKPKAAAVVAEPEVAEPAPKGRRGRKSAQAVAEATTVEDVEPVVPAEASVPADEPPAKPKRGRRKAE